MNHLCNSHCESCGVEIAAELEDEPRIGLFGMTLIGTAGKLPHVLDYGFQQNYSTALCLTCGIDLLGHSSEGPSYSWERCHCCGTKVTDDISAFRIVELESEGLEQHLYNREAYEFISAVTDKRRGPVGYTVCMDCVLEKMDATNTSGHLMLENIITEAVEEGDVYEEVEKAYFQ